MGRPRGKSLIVRPTTKHDFYSIELQESQENWLGDSGLTLADIRVLVEQGNTTTIVNEFDEPMFIGGYVDVAPGRATVWTLVGVLAAPRMIAISKMVKRYLDTLPHRRLEATVLYDFDAGRRWARMMGFQCEGLMRYYTPTGEHHYLYARVR